MDTPDSQNPDGNPSTDPMRAAVMQLPTTLMRPIILGDLTLASPTTQTTIGANGSASAPTANPVGYITIMVGNAPFLIAYYNI